MSEVGLLADVTVSSAQLLALDITPIEIIAGVPGQVIIVHRSIQEFTFGTIPYVHAAAVRDMGLRLSTPGLTLIRDTVVMEQAGIHGSTQNLVSMDAAGFAGSMHNELLADMAGKGMEYYTANPLTEGDGTVRLIVYYTMLTV